MDEIQERKLKLDVDNLKRRLSDAETSIVKDRADIDMLKQIAESNHDILEAVKELKEYAQKTYEVFEPMARYGAKIAKIAIVFTAVWHAVKYAYAKLLLVWP